MNDIRLEGCWTTPLMSYLKALGVLRLVSEQADKGARGWWDAGSFVMRTKLDHDDLERFFLEKYWPTPIVAPWAGGSGFFAGDNTTSVDALSKSKTERLEDYREVISAVRSLLKSEGISKKPSGDTKEQLLRLYRRSLSDRFVDWMDCALVLQKEGQSFPPILGTGGNDGRLDFTQNHMQRLVEVGLCDDVPPARSRSLLSTALFGTSSNGLTSAAIGQFDPGGAGGPNATQGMEGKSTINPWDFILMMEGAVLLAGSVVRRMGADAWDRTSFPFTVRTASPVGYGSAGCGDSAGSRGETWLPTWNAPCLLADLRSLFSEGRAEVSGRQARDGIEFSRAVVGLGVDRGIGGFIRFGYLKRSGKNYLATPLAQLAVRANPQADLLRTIDHWLDGFRSAAREAPPRIQTALRRYDAAVFDFCRYGGRPRFAAVLRALGQIERELALLGGKVSRSKNHVIRPVPLLSEDWLDAADDSSPEFRIAVALASILGDSEGRIGPLRTNLEPVSRKSGWFEWAERDRAVVWSSGSLCRNMVRVLERRMMDASRRGSSGVPLDSRRSVSAPDIAAFIDHRVDDGMIEEFLWGAALIDFKRKRKLPSGRHPLPAPYALLKLLFMPAASALKANDDKPVKAETSITSLLRAGRVEAACELAGRRLRSSGHVPMPGQDSGGKRKRMSCSSSLRPERLAAALLIPFTDTDMLAGRVIRGGAKSTS